MSYGITHTPEMLRYSFSFFLRPPPRASQLALKPFQLAQRPSQMALWPSQLALRPTQLALRPS